MIGRRTLFCIDEFALVVHKPASQTDYKVFEGDSLKFQCLSDDSRVDLLNIQWNAFEDSETAKKAFESMVGFIGFSQAVN